jgi:hypothetical protein
LLAHGRWFSPGTLTSSTTKAGRHDIAKILLKVALNTKKSINQLKCVIQELSVLLQVGGFLRVLRFLPPIKLTATI